MHAWPSAFGLIMIEVMIRFATLPALLACYLACAGGPAAAADRWTEYRSGPFHVISDAGDRAARERLTEMEQLRYVLGQFIGTSSLASANGGKNELDTVWPIDVVLFSNTREYGPHALPRPFIEGGSATLSAWTGDAPLPRDALRALTRLLIEDNAGRMPETVVTALCDLFSTINVNATHVTLGAALPPGELSGDRLRAWVKLQMLATASDYSGKFRVYLNNLQQGGDEDFAIRNAFDVTAAKLNLLVDAYQQAGVFTAAAMTGRALNPNRDFIERPVEADVITALMNELKAGGKSFPLDSPRGLLQQGTRASLELAAKANPRWAEPHFRLGGLETNAVAKVKELKIAATLNPRNDIYWQALAEAQAGADQYADAEKSWASAERTAPNEAERTRIHQARLDLDARRADYEASELQRIRSERAADLQRIKEEAAAEVHAAEAAANARLGSRPAPQTVIPWWDDAQGVKVAGTLTRVDCLNGPIRLLIQKDGGGTARVLIRDLNKLVVQGAKEAEFGCGVQRPARKIRLQQDAKSDAKLGTEGDVIVVEFP